MGIEEDVKELQKEVTGLRQLVHDLYWSKLNRIGVTAWQMESKVAREARERLLREFEFDYG